MFKRYMALVLLLALCLCMFGADASAAGGIIHKVHGDISEFEVQEEAGVGSATAPGASLGTDIYLYVDPYSASYVTFVVVDEDGEPIPGAKIYLGYDGASQFYGTTDENGRFSTYLFRDTYYYYKVMKYGYRSTSGMFKAKDETKTVRVVMRKEHTVDIIVLENGNPVPGIEVIFNGISGKTGKDGCARFNEVLRGEYQAEITLPDGTKKIVTIVVEGDTVYVVEIGTENWPEDVPRDLMDGGAGMSDLFIVFDKYYHPEDYDLTQQIYTDAQIRAQLDPKLLSEAEIEDLVRAYHAENPDYLHIVAEPDKIQHADAPDEIVYDKNGEALYSQRSLILSGWQLLNIENKGMESILFENEEMGVWFDIADLHSEDMARLFELIGNVHAEPEKYPWHEADNFETAEVPYYALPNVWRWMDPEAEYDKNGPVFSKGDFGNTRMELRITPILAKEVERAALGLEKNISSGDMSEIVLVSDELRTKWMREYLADGHMTDTEFAELRDLCAHSTAYRVQLFMRIGGAEVNVTRMVPSMEIRFDVNEDAISEAEEYAWQEVTAVYEAQTGKNKKSMEEIAAEHWDIFYDEYFNLLYEPLHEHYSVENQGWQTGETGYETFPASSAAPVVLDDCVSETDEFLRALNARRVDIFDVDVRHEDYSYGGTRAYNYYPVVSCSHDVAVPVETDWLAARESNLSGLYVIREIACTCVEERRQAVLEKR